MRARQLARHQQFLKRIGMSGYSHQGNHHGHKPANTRRHGVRRRDQ
jgi:hypothetical protein